MGERDRHVQVISLPEEGNHCLRGYMIPTGEQKMRENVFYGSMLCRNHPYFFFWDTRKNLGFRKEALAWVYNPPVLSISSGPCKSVFTLNYTK